MYAVFCCVVDRVRYYGLDLYPDVVGVAHALILEGEVYSAQTLGW